MTAPEKKVNTGLHLLIGSWHTSGQFLSGDDDGKSIKGTDRYEWLPGGHFVMHTADVMMGSRQIHVMEIIGWDETAQKLIGRSYDNEGNYGKFSFGFRGDELLINGSRLRFNGRFTNNNDRLVGIWEEAGKNVWTGIMEITLERKG